MTTQRDITRIPGACFAYDGDREDWPIVLSMTRDSDDIEASNFRVARAELEAIDEDAVAVERASHWAVGWLDRLLIAPDYPALAAAAARIQARIEDYPILSEDDCATLECERAEDCGYSLDCYLATSMHDSQHDDCTGDDCQCDCHRCETCHS